MKIQTTKKTKCQKKCFGEFETGSILFLTALFHMEIIRAAIAMITFFTKTNEGGGVGRSVVVVQIIVDINQNIRRRSDE